MGNCMNEEFILRVLNQYVEELRYEYEPCRTSRLTLISTREMRESKSSVGK